MCDECIIGFLDSYNNPKLVTISVLKLHIAETNKIYKAPLITLRDYCDKRRSTDLSNFEFCPMCGKKIDWKEIKRLT